VAIDIPGERRHGFTASACRSAELEEVLNTDAAPIGGSNLGNEAVQTQDQAHMASHARSTRPAATRHRHAAPQTRLTAGEAAIAWRRPVARIGRFRGAVLEQSLHDSRFFPRDLTHDGSAGSSGGC